MKTVRIICISMVAGLLAGSLAIAAGNKKYTKEYEVIRAGLADTDREIRSLSAKYAGQIGDKDAISGLKNLLTDSGDSVRIKAAVALAKMGERAGIPELRKIAASVAKSSDNPTPLERMRAVAKGTARAEAVRALGDIRDYDSVPLIRRMLSDDDGRVADASLIALAQLGEASVQKRFIGALENEKQGVRAKAAEALGEIGDSACLPELRKRLKDWDRDVKAASAVAVGKLRDRDSVTALKELLADKNEIVREKAAAALGMIGDLSTAADLKKVLQDPNGFVRIAAAESLHRFGDDSGKDFLLKVLGTDDRDAKLKAIEVMGNVASTEDIPALEKLAADSDKTIGITAAKAVITAGSRNK